MIKVLVDGIIYGQQRAGGISRCFTETLTRLGDHANDIEVLLHLPMERNAAVPTARWVRPVIYRKFPSPRLGAFLNNRLVQTLRPAIFHSTYYRPAYIPGLKTVVTVYDFIHERFPALIPDPSFVEQKRRVIEDADVILAISEDVKKDLLHYTRVDEKKVVVSHLGVSDTFLQPPAPAAGAECSFRKRYSVRRPYWLFVGQRGQYKNFGSMLRAFARVAPCTGMDLVLIGGNPTLEPHEIEFVLKNRLETRIHLFHVTDEVLRLAYAEASGFIFPSIAEGFGIPLLEAMACGTPIAASDIAVFHEVADTAAVFFDPLDEEALSDALLRLLDPATRTMLVTRGHERVKAFSWDKAARTLGETYRSLA